MDNQYSSFYLYRKYEVIGDELIDLGITSIDAEGTLEPVMKEECDPACGCPPPEPIYRWVQTEDTVCVGEEPEVQYRWTPSGWTCVGYDKYQNNIKEQSLDEGLTWTVVIPEEYSASTLIKSQSTDCGYVPPTPTIDGKFKLTLSDSSTVTAECDSTSSVTSGEVATQYSGSVTPALVEAEIGDCVKKIGGGAFYKCSGLTSVTISDNVKSISGFAFGSCTSLVTCNMGTGVTKMGSSVFQGCHSLTGITIPNGVTSIEMWTFYQCYSLTSITIPNSVTTIAKAAFNNCTGLTGSLLIPDSVTSIGEGAFSWCKGLSAATIGSGITTIGRNAFYNCNSLTSITVNATTPPALGEDPFSSTNKCPIYVPCASLSVYQSAWSAYASRIECIPKEKIILFEGSESFAQWQPARFSKSEGFLDVYFEHNYNDYLQYLYENNEPLYVEFSSVPDSGTLCLQTGSWSPIFDPALPVSASEPLQIYITDDSMYNNVQQSDLALIDKASNGFTITSVYFYK